MLSFYTCVPHMMIIWSMVPEIWSATDRMFCHFGPFLPFYTIKQPKNSNFWKHEKRLEISSFYISVTKIMIICYTVPDMAHDGCDCYFSFWAIFCPLTLLTAQKIKKKKFKKFWKMKKTPGDIIISHICTKNYDQIMYVSWDIVRNRQTDKQTNRRTEKVSLVSKFRCLVAFTFWEITRYVYCNCLVTSLRRHNFEINHIFLIKTFCLHDQNVKTKI